MAGRLDIHTSLYPVGFEFLYVLLEIDMQEGNAAPKTLTFCVPSACSR